MQLKEGVKVPISENAPVSFNTRPKTSNKAPHPVSIEITCCSSVPFDGKGRNLTTSNFCFGTFVVASTHEALEAKH